MQSIDELLQAALKCHLDGDLGRAEALYKEVLGQDPNQSDALHLLGVMCQQVGRSDLAIPYLRRAVRLQPDNADFHNNLGEAHRRLGEDDEAELCYRRALQLQPNFAIAHSNLGIILYQRGDLVGAEQCMREALRHQADLADGWNNLGNVLQSQGRLADAEPCYRQALQVRPDFPAAFNNLGSLLEKQRKLADAEACYRQCLQRDPHFLAAQGNLATVLVDQGKLDDGMALFAAAVQPYPPGDDGGWGGLVDGLRIKAALAQPVIPQSVEEIVQQRHRLEKDVTTLLGQPLAVPDPLNQAGRTPFALAYHGQNDRDLMARIADLFRKAAPVLDYQAPHTQKPGTRRPVRIGFVSRFLNDHTIGRLFGLLPARLPRPDFHVTLCRFPGADDDFARRIDAGADEVVTLPNRLGPARATIADRRLDILVYPEIGMCALTYFLAFSRLAPVQCATWGHPVTSGLPTIDYFLSAVDLETEASADHYTEKLIRLPRLGVWYERPPLPAAPADRSVFGVPADAHVYGCPQSLFKLHPDFDAVLAAILREDADGYLLLVEGPQPHWSELLRRRFARSMPDVQDRVRFLPHMDRSEYLAMLTACDVLLDPFPFGGGNTSYEGLGLGVPIVTLPTQFLRGRLTFAMLRQMGMTDLVAADAGDYVRRAVLCGRDRDHGREIRRRIAASSGVLFEDATAAAELARHLLQLV